MTIIEHLQIANHGGFGDRVRGCRLLRQPFAFETSEHPLHHSIFHKKLPKIFLQTCFLLLRAIAALKIVGKMGGKETTQE